MLSITARRATRVVLAATFPAPVFDRTRDRYAYGACNRGLPWVDSTRAVCSGDCHPDPD